MNRRRTAVLSAILIGGSAVISPAAPPSPGRSIVDAERAFARVSLEKGMREAFLEFLDDEGVVFRPQPVNGKTFYRERPTRPGALVWQPAHAELAAAGDMGYTTGPWEYREGGPEGKAIAWGYYISVWHDTPDSGWKVLADIGVGLPAPVDSVVVRDVATVHSRGFPETQADTEEEARALLDRERALVEAGSIDGHVKALAGISTENLRVYREGAPPWVGRKAAIQALEGRGEQWRTVPLHAGVALLGDFGYTCGTAEPIPPDPRADGPGSYLHIWRLDGERGWSLALEVIIPGPPKQE